MTTPPGQGRLPILIYAPGLGQYTSNTADGVSDVIAAVVGRRRHGTFSSTTDATVTAPRGLRVGKTVVHEDGSPVLQVFELDYKDRLDDAPSAAGPPASPGAIKSSVYAVTALGMVIRASRRGAKSGMAKFQLFLAFVVVSLLILAALAAIVSGLVAAGVALPSPVEGALGEDAATWTIGIAGVVGVTWAATRKRLLAVAATAQHTIRYLENENRRGDTVAMTVDDAVDGLRDNGWDGDIHLLGYSFGSLVLFDALLPKKTSLRAPDAVKPVVSMTTIGCPIDAVRLFRPEYPVGRVARVENLAWHNIFIAADVFGSNLKDRDDNSDGGDDDDDRDGVVEIAGVRVNSTRYLDEELNLGQVLKAKGFTTHSGYWGLAADASCFDVLVDRWIPT